MLAYGWRSLAECAGSDRWFGRLEAQKPEIATGGPRRIEVVGADSAHRHAIDYRTL